MWVWSLGQEDPLGWEDLRENPHEQRSLAGWSPRGHKESDTTEVTYHTIHTSWLHGYTLHGYMIQDIMELISSTWWGFQYLQDSSQDIAQNIVYSSEGGTKCFWLCLITKLLLCGMWSPLTVFPCFCIFSLLWLNLFFGSGSPQTKGRQRTWWGRTIGSCSLPVVKTKQRNKQKVRKCLKILWITEIYGFFFFY